MDDAVDRMSIYVEEYTLTNPPLPPTAQAYNALLEQPLAGFLKLRMPFRLKFVWNFTISWNSHDSTYILIHTDCPIVVRGGMPPHRALTIAVRKLLAAYDEYFGWLNLEASGGDLSQISTLELQVQFGSKYSKSVTMDASKLTLSRDFCDFRQHDLVPTA